MFIDRTYIELHSRCHALQPHTRLRMALWLSTSCVLLLPLAATAKIHQMDQPHWYVGAQMGQTRLRIDTDQLADEMAMQNLPLDRINYDRDDPGYKFFLGMALNDYLAIESGYFRLGEVEFTTSTLAAPGAVSYPLTGRLRDQGIHVDLVARMPLSENFAVTARLGATYNDTDARLFYQRPIDLDSYNRSKHYLKHKLGIGMEYQLANAWAMRLELERYHLDEIWGKQGDMKLLSIGFVYHYVGQDTYSPSPAPTREQSAWQQPDWEQPTAPAVTQPAQVVELQDVHFEFDQSRLTPTAKAILQQHILTIKQQPKMHLVIAGYTSASGTVEYNQALSERRAKAVQQFLIEEGQINPTRLRSVGYGQTSPLEIETTPSDLRSSAAKANMRVLFQWVLQPE